MRSHSSVPGLSSSTGNISDDQKGRAVCRPVRLSPLPHRPLVSILIPSYNHGRYLSEAIESVLQQTYSRLEVVICDDGSTDASLQILERYRLLDERIKLVRQANGGQSMALNAAFRESAGQIICLLDDDDVFLPDKVQLVVNAFTSAPASGLAVNRMRLVDERRKYVGEIPALYDLPCGWQGASLGHTEPQTLLGLPPSSGLSLHRSVAQIIFPLPDGLKLASDKLIVTLAPLMTPITALEAPLSEYRVHGSNSAGVTKFTPARLPASLSDGPLADGVRPRPFSIRSEFQGYLSCNSSHSSTDAARASSAVLASIGDITTLAFLQVLRLCLRPHPFEDDGTQDSEPPPEWSLGARPDTEFTCREVNVQPRKEPASDCGPYSRHSKFVNDSLSAKHVVSSLPYYR